MVSAASSQRAGEGESGSGAMRSGPRVGGPPYYRESRARRVSTPPRGGPAMYDMSHLKKLKKFAEQAASAWQGYVAFDRAALSDGAVPARTKSLIAIAVAMTTQCPYCIEVHTKKAKAAGCTEQEIAEVVLVAAALRAGAAVTHGTHSLD